jgi:uncharacterized protein (TIGR02246 family)
MNADEQSIRTLIRRWHDATAQGDVATVLSCIEDDAEFLVAGREPMRGRAAFEDSLRRLLQTHRILSTGDVREVQVSGDLAIAVTRLAVRIESRDDGAAMDRSGYAMSVFRRRGDGRWRLIRDANLLGGAG